jgi:DMSO/TMAO reductase YedYZ molybdopterin-dependent catalytic subunit
MDTRVGGLVENPVTLTWKDFLALPQAEDVSDFHCVTTWSRFDNHWPVRVITPKLYAWKGAQWIHRVDFLAKDQKRFWELRGYSNTAEPWANDRYAS